MFKPKLAGFGAAAGFTLSLIAGMLGGNPFGVVLFRALLMGILFGGLTLVLGAVVIRFLPELENPVAAEPSETGGMVDITLGDQGDRLDPFAQPPEDDSGDQDQVPDFVMRGRERRDQDNAGPAAHSETPPGAQAYEDGGVPAYGQAPPAARAHSGGSSGGLDVLPDLEDFVPAKRSADDEEESADGFNAASVLSGSLPSSGGSSGGGNDSETMAKAIRTILTREP